MRCIAHRGFAAEAPENTVAAVGAADCADLVEVDVRRCGSGELVVVHDETVDRVSDGTGAVADHTLSELRALDVLDTGEGVPTLTEVVAALPPGVGLNAELKEPGLAADALAHLRDVDGEVVVSSFSPRVLAAVADHDPSVATAYLTADRRPDPVATARDLGCTHLHPSAALCLLTRVVPRAHDAGLVVNAWTVERPVVARLLRYRGVDGCIADARDAC